MAEQSNWQRAFNRYGDTVYRLALLRDPHPVRAARATAGAFSSLDWNTVALDERTEGHLIRGLGTPRRLSAADLLRRRLRPALPPLPSRFWGLSPTTRLALGLRLTRGYDADAIAAALGRPADEIRSSLVDATAILADEDEDPLPEVCRRSRLLRLDEPGADRPHLRVCEACRSSASRWERTEQALAVALLEATGNLTFPRPEVEALALRLGKPPAGPSGGWRQPRLLSAAAIVVVAVVIGLLVLPRGEITMTARTPATARELLRHSLEHYGAAPTGDGVVHRRFVFDAEPSQSAQEAETWTDAAQPSRHRMQLTAGKKVIEWQVGDGEASFRYFSDDPDLCGRYYAASGLDLGAVNAWKLDANGQETLREARWQFGPWVAGYHFIEEALSAQSVRSLGSVRDGERTILTLAADGPTISGTLLIKLDPETVDLREVREVVVDNGTTRSRTSWSLISEERITREAALQKSIFYDMPLQPEPREIVRSAPILDPACPELNEKHIASPIETLGRGWPPIVGLQSPPTGTKRIFLAGTTGPRFAQGQLDSPYDATLIYVGARRRLQISAGFDRSYRPRAGTVAGSWKLDLRPDGNGRFTGVAVPVEGSDQRQFPEFGFFSEGWTRDELVKQLSAARAFRVSDVVAQRALFYDPDPPPAAVLDLVMPASEALVPEPGRVLHSVVEHELRSPPSQQGLRDPYHAEPPGGTTEAWIEYGQDGRIAHFRAETRGALHALVSVQWGDASSAQVYDARANIVRKLPRLRALRYPINWIDASLANIFLYRQYALSAGPSGTVSLRATVPLTQTDLRLAVQSQQSRETFYSAGGWPWLADLDPQSISYRSTFERSTGRLVGSETYANGASGSTKVEGTTVRLLESLGKAPTELWSFTPPADAQTVDTAGRAVGALQGPRTTDNLAEAVEVAPAPLWGWVPTDQMRFITATVPSVMETPEISLQTIRSAVEGGAAVQLRYEIGANQEITLLEGRREVMLALLRQTPPEWTESEQWTLRLPSAAAVVQAWVMRGAPQQHWIIFELDRTLLVGHYSGAQGEAVVWSALEDLVLLR